MEHDRGLARTSGGTAATSPAAASEWHERIPCAERVHDRRAAWQHRRIGLHSLTARERSQATLVEHHAVDVGRARTLPLANEVRRLAVGGGSHTRLEQRGVRDLALLSGSQVANHDRCRRPLERRDLPLLRQRALAVLRRRQARERRTLGAKGIGLARAQEHRVTVAGERQPVSGCRIYNGRAVEADDIGHARRTGSRLVRGELARRAHPNVPPVARQLGRSIELTGDERDLLEVPFAARGLEQLRKPAEGFGVVAAVPGEACRKRPSVGGRGLRVKRCRMKRCRDERREDGKSGR